MPHHWPNVCFTITISKEYWSHFWWWNAFQTTHFKSLSNCFLSPSKHWSNQKISPWGFMHHTCPQPCIDLNRLLQFSSCELASLLSSRASASVEYCSLHSFLSAQTWWYHHSINFPPLVAHRAWNSLQVILFVFRCLHNLAPSYLNGLLKLYVPEHNLRSSNKVFLDHSIPSTKYSERAFSVSGSVLWNSLLDDIRLLDDIGSFKSKLKTWLFKGAYKEHL